MAGIRRPHIPHRSGRMVPHLGTRVVSCGTGVSSRRGVTRAHSSRVQRWGSHHVVAVAGFSRACI